MNAQLQLQVAYKDGRSYVKKNFFTTPFKVANITEDKTARELHLMLMSSSPGILDGDVYDIKIEVEENASLQLYTQAYQRLFHMKQGATQQLEMHLADESQCCFLPHPSVPHEQSIFCTHNNFYLGSNCRFIFGEVLTCGRKLNGEVFLFSKYQSITQVFLNNKLVIKENLLMQPSLINVHAIGQLEGFTHQASMIYLQPDIDCKKLQTAIIELLSTEKNMELGISAAPVNGLIIRLLGHGAEQLYNCLQRVAEILRLQTSERIHPIVEL